MLNNFHKKKFVLCILLENIVALQTGKIKSFHCRCVEPVEYLKMNKRVANRTLIHSKKYLFINI